VPGRRPTAWNGGVNYSRSPVSRRGRLCTGPADRAGDRAADGCRGLAVDVDPNALAWGAQPECDPAKGTPRSGLLGDSLTARFRGADGWWTWCCATRRTCRPARVPRGRRLRHAAVFGLRAGSGDPARGGRGGTWSAPAGCYRTRHTRLALPAIVAAQVLTAVEDHRISCARVSSPLVVVAVRRKPTFGLGQVISNIRQLDVLA